MQAILPRRATRRPLKQRTLMWVSCSKRGLELLVSRKSSVNRSRLSGTGSGKSARHPTALELSFMEYYLPA